MYYRVIDLLRPESANFRSAAATAHQYIIKHTHEVSLLLLALLIASDPALLFSQGKKPDVKAFLVALFGAEEFSKFSKS